MSLYITDETGKLHKIAGAGGGGSGSSNIVVDSELSSTSENPVQNKVITEVLNNIRAGCYEVKLLWENPNVNAPFAPQNIHLASADYDFLLVQVRGWYGTEEMSTKMCQKGYNLEFSVFGFGALYNTLDSVTRSTRVFTRINDTTYSVGANANMFWSDKSTNFTKTNNELIVPTVIYGFKVVEQ